MLVGRKDKMCPFHPSWIVFPRGLKVVQRRPGRSVLLFQALEQHP